MAKRHLSHIRALARHALGHGAVLQSPGVIRWNVAGRCEDPVVIEHSARKEHEELKLVADAWGASTKLRLARYTPGAFWRKETHVDFGTGEVEEKHVFDGDHLTLEAEVRCRRCDSCRRYRAWVWRTRAEQEIQGAQRTWFLSLTLRPEEQVKGLYRAQLKASRAGTPWHELVPREGENFEGRLASEQFKQRVDALYPEVQLWLKRMRKNSGAKLRYLLVAEAHKSGEPHFHALLHEVTDRRATKRCIQQAWALGFSNAQLVADAKPAAYVCKYLSKSLAARVRASQHYGKASYDDAPPVRAGGVGQME